MASRQYIVLVLKPDSQPVQSSSSDDSDKKKEDFPQGYFMVPKSKRGLENDYYSPSTRKGSGIVNIRLPHAGAAAGVSYEVRGVDAKEFLCVCNKKIQLNPGRLLEDVNNVAYSQTVQQLLDIKSDGKFPPALDPLKGSIFITFLLTRQTILSSGKSLDILCIHSYSTDM